jgi:hypothetical protein
MRILAAADMGADGIELVVWLDEAKTMVGPDGDTRPDPDWIWRCFSPRASWEANRLTALAEVAARSEREMLRRRPVALADLAGTDLTIFRAAAPIETRPEGEQ